MNKMLVVVARLQWSPFTFLSYVHTVPYLIPLKISSPLILLTSIRLRKQYENEYT